MGVLSVWGKPLKVYKLNCPDSWSVISGFKIKCNAKISRSGLYSAPSTAWGTGDLESASFHLLVYCHAANPQSEGALRGSAHSGQCDCPLMIGFSGITLFLSMPDCCKHVLVSHVVVCFIIS